MLVTSRLTIDLSYRDFNRYLYATQNDGNTRAVEITLLSDHSPWTIPADVVGAVSFKKPDKTAGLYDTLPDGETQAVQFSENKLTAILAPQVLTVAGDVSVSIVLFDQALNRLGTFPFTLRVAADPSGGQSVSNDYYAFKTLAELNEAILGHTENRNNPHGVTIAQIGAAPSGYGLGTSARELTKNDNLNDIWQNGNYFWNWSTPTNAYVFDHDTQGAYSYMRVDGETENIFTQTLRSHHAPNIGKTVVRHRIGDTITPWVRCDEGAFAPAGYGLGGNSTWVTDVNHAVANGWYYTDPHTVNIPDGMSSYADIFVKVRADSVVQYIRSVTDNTSLVRYRVGSNSEYIVEWENPPMVPGVEYRTTERRNGKVVYTKLIDCGIATNGAKIESGQFFTFHHAGILNDNHTLPYAVSQKDQTSYWAESFNHGDTIELFCGSGFGGGGYNWREQIWYTKD